MRFSDMDAEIGRYFPAKDCGRASIFAEVHDPSVKVTNVGYLRASKNVQLLSKQRSDVDHFTSDIDRPCGLSKSINQPHGHDCHVGIRERQHVGYSLNSPVSDPWQDFQGRLTWPHAQDATQGSGDFARDRELSAPLVTGDNGRRAAVFHPRLFALLARISFELLVLEALRGWRVRAWNAIAQASTRPEVMERPRYASCA